ncbi:hypothetical protein PBCV1_a031R [Paramecium bursaria Chlorella virus 1]|uniref:Uncharacterized protein n=1 Tax=Paramecium bursaria Chlorella virus 1 TaxID=10506 RepID=Q89366_PBCV1|nr:hypothetical protein PBCV1_a031R [Paramecium bursaria Chlorella virus 1]AAC96399.1 hypothetical protein [Paramecium bursaria Chlorella virus 1]
MLLKVSATPLADNRPETRTVWAFAFPIFPEIYVIFPTVLLFATSVPVFKFPTNMETAFPKFDTIENPDIFPIWAEFEVNVVEYIVITFAFP